jgi:hypothetical protein
VEAQVHTARELTGSRPEGPRTTLPAVLLQGASMWVLEAAMAAGAIATALLLSVWR